MDDWSFEANIERGCLPTGEALEALYAMAESAGEGLPEVVQCRLCGGNAYDLGDRTDCENCGVIPNPDTGEDAG